MAGPMAILASASLAWPLVMRGEVVSPKLEALCTHFGISNEGQHSAMRDVERMLEVYRKLVSPFQFVGRVEYPVSILKTLDTRLLLHKNAMENGADPLTDLKALAYDEGWAEGVEMAIETIKATLR